MWPNTAYHERVLWLRRSILIVLALLAGPLLAVAGGEVRLGGDWRTADRSPTHIAPDPRGTPEAVVLVFGARAFSWRGIFGAHTWIATKPEDAPRYTVHQVLGWAVRRGGSAVVSRPDAPDRRWFGSTPTVLAALRGAEAARAIPRIEAAVAGYPYAGEYGLWPGPNSNTFTAYVVRRVPELRVELPANAIGKDFLPGGRILAPAPSGTGYQLSLWGLLGVMAALEEGIEVNLLGLVFGLDPNEPALKLPGVGRLALWP